MNDPDQKGGRFILSLVSLFIVFILLFGIVPNQAYTPQLHNLKIGVSVHNLTAEDMQLISSANFTWIRVDDSQLGNTVNITENYSLNILGIINKGNAIQNGNVNYSEWNKTVSSLVTEYKDHVQAWEILNEPLISLPNGTLVNFPASDYLPMLKYAYTIIKSIDPKSIVLGFGGIRVLDGNIQNFTWISSLISMGALKYCDAVSLHFYSGSSIPEVIGFEYKAALMQLKSIFGNKSMWITETGQPTTQGQSDYISTIYPLFESFGIEHVFWYDLRDSNVDHGKLFGLIGDNYSQRESYKLLKNMNTL